MKTSTIHTSGQWIERYWDWATRYVPAFERALKEATANGWAFSIIQGEQY